MSEKDFDLICIGRSCVDLYSGEFGVPLERAMTFTKSVGGSSMNIAIGTSRLGLRVGAITGVGQEDNGRYLKWQLSCEGVDVSAVKTDSKRLTAMVLLSIRGDNDFPLIQYRENCADMGLTAEGIDPDYLARAGAVLVTGTHLSREGVRSATMKVLETAKRLALKCILDIDFRPNLWGLQGHDAGSSRWAEACEQVTSECPEFLPYFDLIVGTEEEFFIAGGKTEAMEALREVRRLSKALLVFKLGDKGCAALPRDVGDSFVDEVVYPGFPCEGVQLHRRGRRVRVPASCAAGCAMRTLASCCRSANATGAFAVSRLGCSSAYPSWTELQYFVSHGSKHQVAARRRHARTDPLGHQPPQQVEEPRRVRL
ncbi:MAG: PfkB family carbohydrate kinase [Bilophila wadsworthia]|uniref:PfkB family carbohydrate kinase n=1 Tax=Bilophila wadsworthia TaxID=35833 RepID=UPI00300F2307